MSLNPEWLDEKGSEDYGEFLKDIRESGDGESKETSPHTSASEDDNNDPLQVLIDVNRKVERKKASKIPVRQSKVSHNADVVKSTYGSSLHYEQLGPAEKAQILFDKTSDVEEQKDIVINKIDSIVVDEFISDANTDVKMSKDNLSNLFVPLKKGEGGNQNFTNVSEIERMNVVELKNMNVEHDSRIQKSREEVIADTVNNALSSDDPILEAPEEFRSLSDISCFSVLINKNERIVEPKPCRTVAAIRDHDNVSEPEANTCGWDLQNKGMLESGIENEEICITNQLRKQPVDDKTKSASPSEAENMQCSGSKHYQHVVSGGELKDNDQIQSNSISITEFDTVQHECVCDNNKSMIGLLSDSCSNLEKLQTTSSFVTAAAEKLLNEPHVESLNNLNLCKESLFSDDVYPEGRDSVNELDSSVSDNGAYACAGNEQTLTAVKPSIAIGVERCAQAPRCSRISVATACAASTLNSPKSTNFIQNSTNLNDTVTEKLDIKTHQIDKTQKYNELENIAFNSKSGNRSENASVNDSEKNNTHLFWTFKNGRLVFETAPDKETEPSSRPNEVSQCHLDSSLESSLNGENSENCEQEFIYSCDDNEPSVLCSRDLNRRAVEGQSRLKHLENKLKKAGITDGKCNVFLDDNPLYAEDLKNKSPVDVDHKPQKIVSDNLKDKKVLEQVVDKLTQPLLKLDCEEDVDRDLKNEDLLSPEANGSGDQVDFAGGSVCQFDVRQVDTFSGYNDSEFFLVYDELDNSSDEDECEYEHYHIISEMRGDGSMGTDGERSKQHNPDRENLKSLLKKPGRGRDVKKNRVVFNENKNEFFDADYIILIREECDYDDEEDDGVCTCNDHEMVRLTCCEPNCNCNLYEGYSSDPTPQSPKFAPPLEFVDAVTLSPPEGYKDMELGEQQLLALQQMAMRGQRSAVCRDCSATHDDDVSHVKIAIMIAGKLLPPVCGN
ncbi:hypothetical protein FQR65_LT03744 [Abscondita terminalis]|nr:hypothetical protein FQR65_LT03744 [Abscondita terminalis]